MGFFSISSGWRSTFFFELFSLPFQSVGFGAFLCHINSLTQT
jgi:hypothetical protein